MSRRHAFRWAFLLITATAVGLELLASFDGSDATEPWTDLITTYVPGEITFAAIGALSLWLIVHFAIRYVRRSQERRTPPAE